MSYQEKRNIVNIISTLLITAIYFWYTFGSRPDIGMDTQQLLYFWAKSLLILIPVTIVAKIIIHIVFAIGNAIATRETNPITDERDKLIELKSARAEQIFFGIGFIGSLIALVAGASVTTMFICIVTGGVMAEISGNLSQLYFYRRGF